MAKKALAVISFGTSYPETRHTIEKLEQTLAQAMPAHHFYRAFTSQMILRKIEREEGIVIPNPAELMEQLRNAGYEEVICQSLHIIPGIEYEKMCRQIQKSAGDMCVRIGKPMLYTHADYLEICKVLLEEMPPLKPDEAFVYMGHGTEHIINAAYSQVENTFRYLDAERVYVGTAEGFPELSYIKKRLRVHGVRKVWLAPFMIVAGDHAQHDLAGEEPDSWKSLLEADGYETEVRLRGMGESPKISALFQVHCMQA